MNVDHFPLQTVPTYSDVTTLGFNSTSSAYWKDNGSYQQLFKESADSSSSFPNADLTILDIDVLAPPEASLGNYYLSMPTAHNLYEGHSYGTVQSYDTSMYDAWDHNSISSDGNSCPSLESWSPISECYSDQYYNDIAHVQNIPAQTEEFRTAMQPQKMTIDNIWIGPGENKFWSLDTSAGIEETSWHAFPLFLDEAKANDEALLSTIPEESLFNEYTHIESIYANTAEPEPVQ